MPPIQFRREAKRKLWKGTDLDGLDKETWNITYTSRFVPYQEEGGESVPTAACWSTEYRS